MQRIGTPGTTGILRGKVLTREALQRATRITPPNLEEVVPSELDLTPAGSRQLALRSVVRDVAVAPIHAANSALQLGAGPASQVAGTLAGASASLVRGMGHAAHYAVQNEERLRGLGGGLSTLASDLTLPAFGGGSSSDTR